MLEGRLDVFEAELVHDGDRVVVHVRGEIDVTTAGAFRLALDTATDGRGSVELDLSETTLMDSTGLTVLIATYQRLGQSADSIVVRDPTPIVRRAMQVAGIESLLDIRFDGDGRSSDGHRN